MDLYEALYTTRAMRRVEPTPVPEEVVRQMLDAAIRSPSGSNAQQWRFLTVSDRDTMAKLAPLYNEAWVQLQETVYAGAVERAQRHGDAPTLRMLGSAQWLADNFAQVPLAVFAFSRNDPSGSSIYPAVWSMMLAARGHGVGTTLTTVLGAFKSAEVFELLGVPTDKGWTIAATVTCGYPRGRWGVAGRAPAHDVAYAEHWGRVPAWRQDEPMWGPPG